MTTIGIVSDTHQFTCDQAFQERITRVFAGCDAIIHAGDLTDHSILAAFGAAPVYAVHGNMCNPTTQKVLPLHRTISFDGYTIGICHGAGPRHTIEDRMLQLFPLADCIIFGHTHQPVCRTIGTTLLINPGTFQQTSRYGAPGTYAILTTGGDGLRATLHDLELHA